MFVIWFDTDAREWCVLRTNGHCHRVDEFSSLDALIDVADNCLNLFEVADLLRARRAKAQERPAAMKGGGS